MRPFIIFIVLGPWALGCTNLALQRLTLQHMETTADLRYDEVLNNLVLFYAVPDSLPSYATIYTGTTKLSDQSTINPSTVIGREPISKGASVFGTVTHFQQETMDLPLQRQVIVNWTLDPITGPEKLLAMRASCKWVLFGSDSLYYAERQILKKWDPEAHMPAAHYFEVEEDLKKLPNGWLGCGCGKNVPVCAVYRARYRDKWVWVTPEGMEGLTKFSLIIANIARLKTDETYFPKAETRTVTFVDATAREGPKMKVSVTAYVDSQGRLVAGDGKRAEPVKSRLENIGSDTGLRSTINAAAATK